MDSTQHTRTYKTLVETRTLLEHLSTATELPEIREKAIALLANYPHPVELDRMIGLSVEFRSALNEEFSGDYGPLNPVEFSPSNGGWIFWDECWAYPHGPYESKVDATEALNEYEKTL